jgi:hypothetical protein
MYRLIKTFSDGSQLEFGPGRFDDWCIYLTRPGHTRLAPKDVDYFATLARLAQTHPAPQLYADFVVVFTITHKALDLQVLEQIAPLASKYGPEALEVEILFTILYAGMLAEENKAHTRLGKRIKRLGVHQILVEQLPPAHAATFSLKQGWRKIAAECQQRGF